MIQEILLEFALFPDSTCGLEEVVGTSRENHSLNRELKDNSCSSVLDSNLFQLSLESLLATSLPDIQVQHELCWYSTTCAAQNRERCDYWRTIGTAKHVLGHSHVLSYLVVSGSGTWKAEWVPMNQR